MFLSGSQLIGFGAGGGSQAFAVFAASAVSTSDLTTYTFAGHSIGAAASDRYVILWIYTGTNTRSVSSVTIGGVSATEVIQSGTSNTCAALFIAAVPTGTTADVVVTFNSGLNNCGIATWAAYGLTSPTPIDTDAKSSSSTTDIAFDAMATGAGFGIWGAGSFSGTATFTSGTGTERFDGVIESQTTHTGADAVTTGASVSQTISGSLSSSKAGVGATWK